MSNRDEKVGSMIMSEEEKRYFRALLAWEPNNVEGLARKRSGPERAPAGRFRFLILGSEGCGKTAILTRLCNGSFTGEGQPPNPDYERGCQRRIEIKGETYIVDALELAPSQLSERESVQHAVGITEAAILMYDIRSRDSFVAVQDLYQRIEEALVEDKRPYYGLILVGNKADSDSDGKKASRRRVTEGEGYELARRIGGPRTRCAFRETSARTGENVDGLFVILGSELLRMRRLSQQRRERAEDDPRRVVIGQTNTQVPDKSPGKVAKRRIWSRPWFRTHT